MYKLEAGRERGGGEKGRGRRGGQDILMWSCNIRFLNVVSSPSSVLDEGHV